MNTYIFTNLLEILMKFINQSINIFWQIIVGGSMDTQEW